MRTLKKLLIHCDRMVERLVFLGKNTTLVKGCSKLTLKALSSWENPSLRVIICFRIETTNQIIRILKLCSLKNFLIEFEGLVDMPNEFLFLFTAKFSWPSRCDFEILAQPWCTSRERRNLKPFETTNAILEWTENKSYKSGYFITENNVL